MKTTKRVLAFILCFAMLATSVCNEGWLSLLPSFNASAIAGHEQEYDDARVELDFNKGWSFSLEADEASFLKGYDDSAWEKVDLPHDFSMEQGFSETGTEAESGNIPGGTGWYRKWFNLYDYYSGDRIILNFDGAYQHTYVYVNGQYVGENHYGYNSFSFEISDYLICSNTSLNLIAVKVVNDIPSSRWYSGSGIYRDVTLTLTSPTHVSLYGPQITTPGIENGDGTAEATIEVHNSSAISRKITVEATVLDSNHNAVSETATSSVITVPAKTEKAVVLKPEVSNPKLWSPDDPNLYTLKTVIKSESGELLDEYHTTFGYRYISWDADNGFSINGEYTKLKGVSLHHDQGALGAVQEYESLYRQLVILKEMGCNAIRTTHNTASRVLLELCNELGIFVMEEFFDGWDASKNYNEHDFSEYFNQTLTSDNTVLGGNGQKWFEFVVEQTILRDRHDPCIIAWGVGNELCNITNDYDPELLLEATANYENIVKSIVAIADELDPGRVLTQGNNKSHADRLMMIDDYMDVIGGNYAPDGWKWVMAESDDFRAGKPFVATEAASANNSRGIYYTMGADETTHQCTSYDTYAVSWGNTATEAWYYAATNDWFSGEFVWTGFDYIGETTPWMNHAGPNENFVPNTSYFGIIDTAGLAKDSYYLYRSWWNEESTTLHLVPGSWNSENLLLTDGYVNVAVYSNAKKVELLLNGNVIATATSTVTTTPAGYTYRTWTESIVDSANCAIGNFYTGNGADFYPQFNVKYAAGTLSVKAYDENNNEITDTVGSTKSVTGTAAEIVMTTWQNKDTYVADGADYIYVEFEARDADGNFMNDYNGSIEFKIDENSARYAEIIGIDNGNSSTTEKFQQDSVIKSDALATIQLFNGRAVAIIKTTEEEGTINFTATTSDGLTEISIEGVTVSSETETDIELTDEFEEVIIQSGDKYEPTLYDEYEVTKFHIENLKAPTGGSGNQGSTTTPTTYEVFPVTSQTIPDGDYVVFNQNYEYIEATDTTVAHDAVFSTELHWGYALLGDEVSSQVSAPEGSAYAYESFYTDASNIFTFTHISDDKYYIQNSAGEYLNIGPETFVFKTYPQEITVTIDDNGSLFFSYTGDDLEDDWGIIHFFGPDHFYAFNITQNWQPNYTSNASCKFWLYKPNVEAPPADDETDKTAYEIYLADSTNSNDCVISGDYVVFHRYGNDTVLSTGLFEGWCINGDTDVRDKVSSPAGSAYPYSKISTSDTNVFKFTHISGNKYTIQNVSTGEYVKIGYYTNVLSANYSEVYIKANYDGSILIYSPGTSPYDGTTSDFYLTRKENNDYFYAEDKIYIGNFNSEYVKMWLYSPKVQEPEGGDDNTGSAARKSLHEALLAGTELDLSDYTRASGEALLALLEEGVALYQDANATDAELKAAADAIWAAIEALSLDIKKINGTLFKYGYNNSTGTPNYDDGGALINDISVSRMKTAILANPDLVRQIKDVIGYDDPNMGWTGDQANVILDKAAELYARVYTLMFTGVPHKGISSSPNTAPGIADPLYDGIKIPLTLWNVWTKDGTHGENDPHENPNDPNSTPIYDGASVQGLASATLDNGVITSHSAYSQPLSYANDGPSDVGVNYDIEEYTYAFSTGSKWVTVDFEYLSGISVYFPDLFSREALDANGNVTDATSGQFSKYYWDTEFPMFISTDEYGVNTYHYDSADTRYLVQADFDDANHTVDMDLNEVDNWTIVGPNNITKSGFFPFNYQQGTTNYSGENAVYHYGFTFEHNFYIPVGGKHVNGEDVIFNFSGDDDVYVYIDGVLVLDNGGLHGARAATINFTECSINYQYAIDVADGELKGDEFETTYSYNAYLEDPDATGYNADTIAAINKLHEVITDGKSHTLTFFYLERGASDSNCKISFNLSETSEDVRIIDQTLTLDYGLPVEYNITENNKISKAAIDNGATIEYLGICAINKDYTPTYTFEIPQLILTFEDNVTYELEGMRYGTCTIDKQGNVSYSLESTNMTQSESFYVVAKITGDPTYADEVVYYQIEKTTFVPATAIYYEDTFDTITYTDGKVPTNYDNTANQYGIWHSKGLQQTTLKQTADLTDSEANPYGYETNYSSFSTYSGGSVRYTDVSIKNNPSSRYSGGTGAAWPTINFTFTGTGFDLISITDSTTGAFSVSVKDINKNKTVWNTVVDTFYGYNYGRIYADENGNLTLDDKLTPMYRAENGSYTSAVKYYDENGAITNVAHYYDADGNVVETETDNPSYAFAYGWIVAEEGTTDTLYQIPVIKVTNLAYSNYSVTITPTFTSAFGHSSTAEDGTTYYSVYLDAIKIYSPAGVDDDIADKYVKEAYATDDEMYPNYLEIKDMLIGADSLSVADKQGIIFIDGIAALDNDLETYKTAGPNNELYLAKDQAVAFEIWATSVPTDIQLGTKLACGNPDLTISYASKTTEVDITTATDMYYSLNTILPNDAKLTWRQVTGSDGNNYYTTGTVVIQNTGDEDSVLSVTNMKWTFSENGGKGYFRIPTPVENEVLTLTTTVNTQSAAYSLIKMRTAALDIEQTEEPVVVTDEQGNSTVTIKFKTSPDVDSVVVTDESGTPTDPKNVTYTSSAVEGEDAVEWTVTITTDQAGTHVYMIAGAYENGYTDDSKTVTVTVTIEVPVEEEQPDDDTDDDDTNDDSTDTEEPDDDSEKSVKELVIDFFIKVFRFIRKVLSWLGINFNAI